MKKVLSAAFLLLAASSVMASAPKMSIRDITSWAFAAKTISGIHPIDGTDQYARISQDGKQIVQYSFKTGKQTAVLFDIDNTMGEKIRDFDGYVFSPKGDKMLISANTEKIYRRSYKADFYIYNIKTTKLEKLSDNGKQQVPLWSPDGNQIAFVRNNNLFLKVKLPRMENLTISSMVYPIG